MRCENSRRFWRSLSTGTPEKRGPGNTFEGWLFDARSFIRLPCVRQRSNPASPLTKTRGFDPQLLSVIAAMRDRPLAAFAGIWTEFKGDGAPHQVKADPRP